MPNLFALRHNPSDKPEVNLTGHQGAIARRVETFLASPVFDDAQGSAAAKSAPLADLLPSTESFETLCSKDYMQTIKTGWPSDEVLSPTKLKKRFDCMSEHSVLGLAYDRAGSAVSTVTGILEPLPDGGVRLGLENLTTRHDSQQHGYAKQAVDHLLSKIDGLPIKYAGGTSLQPHAHAFYQRCGMQSAGIEYGKTYDASGAGRSLAPWMPLPKPLVLRRLEQDDLGKGFDRLLEHGFHPEAVGPITPEIFAAFIQRCGRFKRVFVIEDTTQGAVVATASYFNEVKLTEGDGRPTGRMSGVAIQPGYASIDLLGHIFAAVEEEATARHARCLLAHGTASQRSWFAALGMVDKTLELGVFVSADARLYFDTHRDAMQEQTWRMAILFQLLGVYNRLRFLPNRIGSLGWSQEPQEQPAT